MSKPPRRAKPPNWSRKLARVIMLDDGRIGSELGNDHAALGSFSCGEGGGKLWPAIGRVGAPAGLGLDELGDEGALVDARPNATGKLSNPLRTSVAPSPMPPYNWRVGISTRSFTRPTPDPGGCKFG